MSNLRVNELESLTTGRTISVDNIALGVVAVESIADLLALPEGQRKEDLRYLVKGYHAGSGVGGGEFFWDAASTEAPNGGTIFELADVSEGRWVRVLPNQTITPEQFGTRSTPEHDDSVALNAAFAYCAALNTGTSAYKLDWSGEYYVANPVFLSSANMKVESGTIRATAPMENVLTLTGGYGRHSGLLRVFGHTTGDGYADRTCTNALVVAGHALGMYIEQVDVRDVKRDGVLMGTGAGYSVISMTIDKVNYQNTGSCSMVAHRRLAFDYTDRVDTGTENVQRSTLSVDAVPLELLVRDRVSIGGEYYTIKEIDRTANTIGVHPWITSAEATSGTVISCHGAGVHIATNNASSTRIGSIRGLFAGVGYWSDALYGGTVGQLLAEYTSIGLLAGSNVSDAHVGLFIGSAHFEVCEFNIIIGARSNSGVTIGAVQYFEPKKVHGAGWLGGYGGTRGTNGLSSLTVFAGGGYTGAPLLKTESHSATASNSFGSNDGVATFPRGYQQNITLSLNENSRRIHGNRIVRRLLTGYYDDAYKRNMPTIIAPSATDLAAGIRVMGGKSYAIPASYSQVFVTCVYDSAEKNWLVTYTVSLIPSTKIKAPTGGETTDTEARATLNRIIATLEANGLSLRS